MKIKLFREFNNRVDLDTCNEIADSIISEVETDIQNGQRTNLFGGLDNVYSLDFAFTKDGVSELLNDSNYLKPFIDEVVDTDKYNAFYLNALIIDDGNSVQKHLDVSLSGFLKFQVKAHNVSVLYLRVPDDMVGGELKLYLGNVLQSVKPEAGKIVSFDGYPHSVDVTHTKHQRISLVLESYYLMEESYSKIPTFCRDKFPYETFNVDDKHEKEV
tara:strand:+ start:54 stop:698 length:645 start_codon:yes stop_codon:yes gene_type:complete